MTRQGVNKGNANGKDGNNGTSRKRMFTEEQCEEMLDFLVDRIMEDNGIYFPETKEEVDKVLNGKKIKRRVKKDEG